MTFGRSDLIDIAAILCHETERAYLLDTGDEEKHWVPKSMCELERGEGRSVVATMPEWIAKEKGLI